MPRFYFTIKTVTELDGVVEGNHALSIEGEAPNVIELERAKLDYCQLLESRGVRCSLSKTIIMFYAPMAKAT